MIVDSDASELLSGPWTYGYGFTRLLFNIELCKAVRRILSSTEYKFAFILVFGHEICTNFIYIFDVYNIL